MRGAAGTASTQVRPDVVDPATPQGGDTTRIDLPEALRGLPWPGAADEVAADEAERDQVNRGEPERDEPSADER